MASKPKTRKCSEHFLIGHEREEVPENQLPVARDILAYLVFRKGYMTEAKGGFNVSISEVIGCVQKDKSGELNCVDSCTQKGKFCCVFEAKKAWLKAGIPTTVDKNIKEKISKLYSSWQKLKKNCNKTQESVVSARDNFQRETLDKVGYICVKINFLNIL